MDTTSPANRPLTATIGNDSLHADCGSLFGLAGKDISRGAARQAINGGAGSDRLSGDRGNDLLVGRSGNG
jgi:Ca2+-binding RTX toxin-like protein